MYQAVALAIISVLVMQSAMAQEWPEDKRAEFAAAGTKYGLTIVRAIAASGNTEFPAPTGNVSAIQRRALEKTLQGYVEKRANYQGTLMTWKSSAEFLIDGTAIAATASGVGAVPAAVFKATAQVAADAFFASVENDMKQSLSLYLKQKEPELLQLAGGNYEEFRQSGAKAISAKLDRQATIFAEIKSMVGNDSIAQGHAQEMVIQAIRNTSKETLDLISTQDERLNGIETKFTKLNSAVMAFENHTKETLDQHSATLVSLQKDMGLVQQSVYSIDSRLKTQERNAGFVTDFVFDRMPPEAKAKALKAGFLAERFVCPADKPNCKGPELKADLIQRYEAEGRIERNQKKIAQTVKGLNDVATIANNLGLELPHLGEAVQYGNAAATAFNAFLAQDYLGAIASVTGVFQKRVNPDEERFKVLMGTLDKHFTEIKTQLKTILENQQAMMKELVNLSEQMRTYYEALNERLARMEFEINRVGAAARAALWQDWDNCAALYDHIVRNEKRYQFLANGDILNMKDIYHANNTTPLTAIPCAAVAQKMTVSIAAPKWFGNLLDARLAYRHTPQDLQPEEAAKEKALTRDNLKEFIDIRVHFDL